MARPCTSTPAVVSTTARGCRSRSCTPRPTSPCCSCRCRRPTPPGCSTWAGGCVRDHGVLIIGSGYLTHGLPFLRDWSPDAKPPGWSVDFDLWAAEALSRGDLETLSAFGSRAPGMPSTHPTVEAYVPLFIALGAATDPEAPPQTVIDGYFFGLSKRSVQVA